MKYHDTFIKFWIIKSIKRKINKIKKHKNNIKSIIINKFYRHFEYWYCGNCNKYHSSRVINYCEIDFEDGSCDENYNYEEELKKLENNLS